MTSKLNIESIKELLKIKNDGNLFHRESQTLEFKESFNFASLADYYKDFSGFANNQGGYIIFGVKDRPRREVAGLEEKSYEQFDALDPEKITGDLLEIFSTNINWTHDIFKIDNFFIASFYIFEVNNKPVICKKDFGRNQTLKNGEIYYRYGGRTQKIQYAELENIINKRIEQNNSHWMDLITKIGKSGPENAAILNTEQGIIEKKDNQILIIDEELVDKVKWIKEGSFSEKEGHPTLKLVGDVQQSNQIEVIQRIKDNKLKEYPLSATELVDEIKKINPIINKNKIWEVIKENGLKNNKDYSIYVFKNIKQEQEYEKNKKVQNSTPSIYKESTVTFILNALSLEKQDE